MKKIIEHIKESWYKYLLEILVITSGILLAFGLNNWNDERKQKQIEIESLKQLREGFLRDIDDIKLSIGIETRAIRSGNIIINFLEKDLDYTDSLNIHFSHSQDVSGPYTDTGPFESLKIKGMDIITNDSIRYLVSNYFNTDVRLVRSFSRDKYNFYSKILVPFLIPRFNESYSNDGIIPNDYENLKTDTEYLHIIKSHLWLGESIQHLYVDMIKSLEHLIQLINTELERLEGTE